jgi:hypothetical protein
MDDVVRVNFKVGRTETINIKNFESIKPLVEIEVLNIPIDSVDMVYTNISDLLDSFIQLEQSSLYCDMKSIRKTGIDDHIKSIINQDFDNLRSNIKVTLGDINKNVEDKKHV